MMWPSASQNGVGTPNEIDFALNTLPACTPVNASPAALRRPRMTRGQDGSLFLSLPTDYVGERHVVIVKREPRGKGEWCEFEKRPGPAPVTRHRLNLRLKAFGKVAAS